MKRFLNFLLLSAAVLSLGLMMASKPSADRKKDTKTPIYMNTSYSFEERAVDLVSRLTLEEKQSLLGNSMAAVTGIKPPPRTSRCITPSCWIFGTVYGMERVCFSPR